MNNVSKSAIVCAALLVVGCATTTGSWKAEPPVMQGGNESFDAKATVACNSHGCNGFELLVKNKTDRTLEVDWNKTRFIAGGQAAGGFMFAGVVYRDRNNSKPSDIVFASGTMSKGIWPNNLVEFNTFPFIEWVHKPMPQGEVGIYLTVVVDGKEISQKLTTIIASK